MKWRARWVGTAALALATASVGCGGGGSSDNSGSGGSPGTGGGGFGGETVTMPDGATLTTGTVTSGNVPADPGALFDPARNQIITHDAPRVRDGSECKGQEGDQCVDCPALGIG